MQAEKQQLSLLLCQSTIEILHSTNQRGWLMLSVTSKGEFPYAEARKFGGQLDMEASIDKPGSILMEAVCQKIIIFFIKPSDSNLSGICVYVCRSYLKPGDKY